MRPFCTFTPASRCRISPALTLWFGLLEHRSEKIAESRFGEHHFYRKAALFDRMLTFDVAVDLMEGSRH